MDIKEKIEEIAAKIKGDDKFAKNFREDPVKSVESILGVDLPDDIVKKVIDGVKAKVSVDDISGKIGGILGKLKK